MLNKHLYQKQKFKEFLKISALKNDIINMEVLYEI